MQPAPLFGPARNGCTLTAQMPVGDFPELVVHEREQLVACVPIARRHRGEEAAHFSVLVHQRAREVRLGSPPPTLV